MGSLAREWISVVLTNIAMTVALARPAPPRPLGAPGFEHRVAELKQHLAEQAAVDVSAQRALQYSKRYVTRAEKVYRTGNVAQADRIAEAAANLLRVAEHQRHLRAGGAAVVPSPEQIETHVRQLYFQTQQADYFLQQAHDPEASAFPEWAREFYHLALRAYDRKEWIAADENAKCAEEIVRSLEHLAQSASIGQKAPASVPPTQQP